MPDQASSAPTAALPFPPDALAPDLVALFLGATPHPDIVIPEPVVTIAALAAAARAEGMAAGAAAGTPGRGLRWDAARQRFAS